MTTLEELDRKLDRILAKLNTIQKLEAMQMVTIDTILDDLAELPTIDESLDALFAQLQTLIASGDPAKLKMADDLIVAHKARTKAAIVANTPAA